eukprot:scaffold14853_cov52-Attheya_sp.AAC.1
MSDVSTATMDSCDDFVDRDAEVVWTKATFLLLEENIDRCAAELVNAEAPPTKATATNAAAVAILILPVIIMVWFGSDTGSDRIIRHFSIFNLPQSADDLARLLQTDRRLGLPVVPRTCVSPEEIQTSSSLMKATS